MVAVGHDMSALESAKQIDGVSVDGHSGAAPPFRQRTLTVPPVRSYFYNFYANLRKAVFREKNSLKENVCGQPCIFSWPMVISNSVNEFFVAV